MPDLGEFFFIDDAHQVKSNISDAPRSKRRRLEPYVELTVEGGLFDLFQSLWHAPSDVPIPFFKRQDVERDGTLKVNGHQSTDGSLTSQRV